MDNSTSPSLLPEHILWTGCELADGTTKTMLEARIGYLPMNTSFKLPNVPVSTHDTVLYVQIFIYGVHVTVFVVNQTFFRRKRCNERADKNSCEHDVRNNSL
jgi:hypothetical protein